MGEKGDIAGNTCSRNNYKRCNIYNSMKYAKFKLLTRVIKGGKENSVLSWSQFPFKMSLITSDKGTTVAAAYKIVEIIDVYGTFLTIPKQCMVNQCKSNEQKNPSMFFNNSR